MKNSTNKVAVVAPAHSAFIHLECREYLMRDQRVAR